MKVLIAPKDVRSLMDKLGKGASCAYSATQDAWIVAHPDKPPMIGNCVPEGERMHFEQIRPSFPAMGATIDTSTRR